MYESRKMSIRRLDSSVRHGLISLRPVDFANPGILPTSPIRRRRLMPAGNGSNVSVCCCKFNAKQL